MTDQVRATGDAFAATGPDDLRDRLAAVDIGDVVDALDDASADALRALDAGVRLLGETRESAVASSRAVSGRMGTTITATPVTSSERLSRDRRARRAFVLGGPDALTALGPG